MLQILLTPNLLSLIRIMLTPLVAFCIMGGEHLFLLGFALFNFAALTDYADGYIARRYGLQSSMGIVLDPFADKVLVLGALAAFAYQGMVPLWVVGIIAVRDLVITVTRFVLSYVGRPLVTSNFGKAKTVLQLSLIYLLMMAGLFHGPLLSISLIFSYIVAGVTVVSGLDYLVRLLVVR